MKSFYDIATQVVFKDCKENTWQGGIAYQNYIICGCCGGTIFLEDIKEAEGNIRNLEWVDISESIKGDIDFDD